MLSREGTLDCKSRGHVLVASETYAGACVQSTAAQTLAHELVAVGIEAQGRAFSSSFFGAGGTNGTDSGVLCVVAS